jgi:hypothetical protein
VTGYIRPQTPCKCAAFLFPLGALDDDDAVAVVVVEERQAFHNPGIEAAARVAEDLTYDVTPIAQPGEFAAGRRGPDGLFAFFALIAELHALALGA